MVLGPLILGRVDADSRLQKKHCFLVTTGKLDDICALVHVVYIGGSKPDETVKSSQADEVRE